MRIKRFQIYAYDYLSFRNSSKCKVGSYDHVFEVIQALRGIHHEFIDWYDIHEGAVMRIEENSFFR